MTDEPVAGVEHDGPSRWWRVLLTALAVLPIAVAIIRAMVHHWFPIGDSALLYVRVRDVFTSHHPLLGSWTSASLSVGENMNNPGPLYDDLLAPFAHLLPAASTAALGVGVVNAASVVGSSIAARHIGGWSMQRWVLLAAAALSWSMGSEMLIDIWQAHALLLPFFCFLVLAVGISLGRWRCIPWAVLVATLLIQTHISYAYILACLSAAVIVMLLAEARLDKRPIPYREWRAALTSRVALWSYAVFALTWVQPLYEQFFSDGRGNLTRLASHTGGGDLQLGMRSAIRLSARVLVEPPWQLRRGYATLIPVANVSDTPDGPRLFVNGIPGVVAAFAMLALLVVVLAALVWVHRRRGNRVVAHVGALAIAGVGSAVLCLALLTIGRVGLAQHHVRWLWTMTVFIEMAIAWALLDLIAAWWRARAAAPTTSMASKHWVSAVVLTAFAALTVANLPYLAQPQGPVTDYAAMPALTRIFRQLEPLRDSAPVFFDTSNVRVYEPYSSAVMMRLQELDIEFRVSDEGMVRQLGDSRRASGNERTRIFQLEGVAALTYDGSACRIAIASARTPAQEDEAATLAESLAAQLVNGTLQVDPNGLSDDHRERLTRAQDGDEAVAMVLVEDGALADWVRRGLVADPDPALAGQLDLIGAWVFSTYALFADNPATCPTV